MKNYQRVFFQSTHDLAAQYFHMIPNPTSADGIEAQKNLPSLIHEINNLIHNFNSKISLQQQSPFKNGKDPNADPFSPSNIYYFTLIGIQNQYYYERKLYFQEQISSLNIIVQYTNQDIEKILPIQFSAAEYCLMVNTQESEAFHKFITFSNMLENKIKNYSPMPEVSIDKVLSIINECQKFVEVSIEYSPFCKFDEIFQEFIISSHYYAKIDSMLEKVIQTQNPKNHSFDFSPANKLLVEVFEMFVSRTTQSHYMIRSALIRVIFEKFLCLLSEEYNFLSIPETSSLFYHKCQYIMKQTPLIIGINSVSYSKSLANIPLHNIISKNSSLKKASEHIFNVQFFTNPLDIAHSLFKALKSIESFIQETSSSIISSLSFDDYLTYFYVILSYNPPSNSVALANFFSHVYHISMSDPFNYVIMLFTSSVQYIEEYQIPS